jgi:hypothetical protein
MPLAQIEARAVQLPPQQQLRLLSHLCERLSELSLAPPEAEGQRQRREYAARVEAFLRMCDEHAAECVGEVDSAEDLRQVREERMSRL